MVCFYRQEEGNTEKADKSTEKVRINTEKVRINLNELSDAQKEIVAFLIENHKITNKQVQKILGVKDSRALKILKQLVEMQVIEKQGKLKGSYYILNKKDA